jgi:hypothetical protein
MHLTVPSGLDIFHLFFFSYSFSSSLFLFSLSFHTLFFLFLSFFHFLTDSAKCTALAFFGLSDSSMNLCGGLMTRFGLARPVPGSPRSFDGDAPDGVAPVGVAPVGVAPVGVAPVGVAPVGGALELDGVPNGILLDLGNPLETGRKKWRFLV